MTDYELPPMAPTPDIGPIAPDAGTLESIGDGVWAWIGRGTTNVGVVVDDDGLTLIDATCAPSVARALLASLEQFDRPVRHVVYTSSHLDSVGGSSVFWMAARYGRSWTDTLLSQPAPIDAYRRLRPDFADDYTLTNDHTSFRTQPVSHVVDAAAWLTERSLAIPVVGQQQENLVISVPSSDVLFAGAFAVFDTAPNVWDGNPSVWADALDEVADLVGDGIVVPGTGRIGGADDLRALAGYLRACVDADGDTARIPEGPWDDWTARDLDAIAVERAAMLARGDDGVPPTMLRRLGLLTD